MTPTQFLFGKKEESTKIDLVAGGGSDGSDVPGHRLDLLGRLLLLPHTGFHPGNKLFIILLSHTEEEIPRRQGILSSSLLILSHGKRLK